MEEKKRMANYELLRVLAMVMVVVMHFLDHSGRLLALDQPIRGERLLGSVLESFCLVAVNTYVLLSGYFGVRSAFRPSRAVSLLCQIWFYSLLIPLVLWLSGIPTAASRLGIYGLVQYVFPLETEHYWFATSYFMLYLLTPLLSRAVKGLSREQLRIVLGGLLILFCGIKSVSPVAFAFDRYGYDLPWFICVWLVGAYLSLYGGDPGKRKGWRLYVGSCLVSFGINLAMWVLARRWDGFSYYFTVPFHYNFILCLTGAVGLFQGFAQIRVREGRPARTVRRLGELCFGVYLLHEHIDLRGSWYGWLEKFLHPGAGGQKVLWQEILQHQTLWQEMAAFLWELVFCTVILFGAGILTDWIRSRLFAGAAALLSGRWPWKKAGIVSERLTKSEMPQTLSERKQETGLLGRLQNLDECFKESFPQERR